MKIESQCPLCKSSLLQIKKETHLDCGITYTLNHCSSCDAEYWTPLKNPGAEWYARDLRYASRNADPHIKPNKNHILTMKFLKNRKPGKVLDIGCGTGNFVKWAESFGWEGWGIDFDPDAIQAAKEANGLKNMFVCDLSAFYEKNRDLRFDLITFFDVFEHIDDHNDFVEIVSKLLNPKGIIAMSMPNREGARFLMGADIPPRHLTRWDKKSLSTYFSNRGYNMIVLKRRSEGLRFLILKLRFVFGGLLSFGLVQKVRSSSGVINYSKKNNNRLVKLVKLLAFTKDAIMFGIPAFFIWLIMLPSKKRYVTLFAIAEKK